MTPASLQALADVLKAHPDLALIGPKPTGPTVADCIDAVLAFSRSMRSRGRANNMRRPLLAFRGQFADKPAAELRTSDLVRFLAAHPSWKSGWSKRYAVREVIAAFRWCADEDMIPPPRLKVPRSEIPTPKPRRPITSAEYRKLILSLRWRGARHQPSTNAFRAAMLFMWLTGCRTCEMRSVTWEMIDWQDGVIRLTEHKTAGKVGDERLIPLNRHAMRLLRFLRGKRPHCRGEAARVVTWKGYFYVAYASYTPSTGWQDRRRKAFGHDHAQATRYARSLNCHWANATETPTGPIFRNGRGDPWTKDTFGELFRKYADRAGIDRALVAYSLRHGFAVRAIEAGVSTRALADVLGHASTKYVDVYARGTRGNVAHLRNVLDAVHRGR